MASWTARPQWKEPKVIRGSCVGSDAALEILGRRTCPADSVDQKMCLDGCTGLRSLWATLPINYKGVAGVGARSDSSY